VWWTKHLLLSSNFVDHVSTTNTLYRKEALESVKRNDKYFDETFFYGLDNDISYRLKNNGWLIIQLKNIGCYHFWKESLRSYLKMSVNQAKARLELIKNINNLNLTL